MNHLWTPSTAHAAPAVVGTSTTLPRHHYRQQDLLDLAAEIFAEASVSTQDLARFFTRTGVHERFLALPADGYRELDGFAARSRAWIEVATELGERALRELLDEAEVPPAEIAELMTTTVTGIAVPTLDARLMNRLPFSPALKRVPAFGLGCVGGAAGIARVADYLRGHPDELAILLAVELCSLTVQRSDASIANIICAGLFGDGAAGVLIAGAEHPRARGLGPRILDSRSIFFPQTERVMGWDMVDTGFKIVLSADVPTLARTELPGAVDAFLGDWGLARGDIATWVTHPGGPKVMDAIEQGLGLASDALRAARDGLAALGNLSSASVLFLLDAIRRDARPQPGAFGLLMAMGPAFCAELVLLQW
ncbi:Alpha-pyrone synthesis polyketide synthase-like Pks11 [Enhygromyxa salina]|uniref:Alpha-pyrone synthesis polyketide synthase-like Pks11 n=1 Tax=Enhygromyxa salina TaxID=215803 RepID=A0A2S9XJH9_9BACT|nr:3-oxoacyl-[acyl-carrier-protein] synthase III C-terminal domain-containing protein [Enhygromyxa salina]PRP93039.1 Alpha-pyrone synthesis polyketide synthase-like Pks11 [Enhygromyxa salina]